MATISRFDRCRRPRARAQLLIATGVVLALAVLALALALNSASDAQRAGSQDADIGGTDVAAFVTAVETEGTQLLEHAHETDDVETTFRTSIAEWNALTRHHYLSRGVYADVSVAAVASDGSAVVLDVTYESSQLTYQSTVTVEPGQNDD